MLGRRTAQMLSVRFTFENIKNRGSARAVAGTRTAVLVSPAVLRRILAVVLLFVAVQMALYTFGVRLGR